MRRATDPDATHIYTAVEKWKERSLLGSAALFDPDTKVWTQEVVDEIYSLFIEQSDLGNRSFMEKLKDQMRGVSQPAALLMAELMYIHQLPLTNVKSDTKLAMIDSIGGWAPEPFTTPEEFKAATSPGIFNGGTGFNTGRFRLIGFLIRFARRLVTLSADQRVTTLNDPWKFKALLHELPSEGAVSQRNALLMLLFPSTFEDISSREHKRRIVAAFPEYVGESSDIDRQILSIRETMTAEFGQDFSWYDEDTLQRWDNKVPRPSGGQSTPNQPAEALSTYLPEAVDRRLFCEAIADAILVAHEVNPKSWSLSFRKRGFFLNIGPNRSIAVESDGVGIALTGESPQDLRTRLESASIESHVPDRPFAFPGNTYFIATGVDQISTLMASEHSNLISTTKETASRDTPYWRWHSSDALDVVRKTSGRKLPDMPLRKETEAHANQKAWIVHVKRGGKRDTATSLKQGDSRIFWKIDVPPGSSLEAIKAALRSRDPEISNNSIGNQGGSIHRFITKVNPGDLIVMPDGSDLYCGVVVGDARYDKTHECWVRSVDWNSSPVDRADVSPALYSRLRSLLTITEITELLPEVANMVDDENVADLSPLASVPDITLASIDADTASDWMLEREWLAEIVELLQRKRQLIFFGPPGTGKTFLAEKIARHLTTDVGSFKLVQFHPSYSYEDFVEGFRPEADDQGNLSYQLTPGPLKILADAARASPDEPFLLLIDEINRGNLAKIFGELYYLLEYREQSLTLQYGSGEGDEFSLPKNLYIIGTMNTADRSIAMVDAAIRRRFNFIEFSPNRAPIRGLLESWLNHHGLSHEPALVLEELNRRLDDDDYAIGPSYLMNEDAKSQTGLERIWKYSIMPLLEEHFYGQKGATAQFELTTLQSEVRRTHSNSDDA